MQKKKTERPIEGNCQVNDVIYECDVTKPLPEKVYPGLAERERERERENGSVTSVTINYHFNTKGIPIRQQLQAACGT